MQKISLFLFVLLTSITAFANPIVPYSKSTFGKLQDSGQTIALQYHASWCPICKKQKNSLEAISKDKAFDGITVVTADYDTETELKKVYSVSGQSTIVLFKGKKEIARVQGTTDQNEIRDFLGKAK